MSYLFMMIDHQQKILNVMYDQENVLQKSKQLLIGAKELHMPMLSFEQYPEGLGPTAAPLLEIIEQKPISKTAFSAWQVDACKQYLADLPSKPTIVLFGIETHICIYQTAKDLRLQGYDVEIVVDATSSRTAEAKAIGIEKMKQLGVTVTNVEMILFELLSHAKHPSFKAISKLIK